MESNRQFALGYDLLHVEDIKKALLESPTQLKGMKYAIAELDYSQTSARSRRALPFPLNDCHSFQYRDNGTIKVWRYYEIGEGIDIAVEGMYAEPRDPLECKVLVPSSAEKLSPMLECEILLVAT